MEPWIQTYSGVRFFPFNPDPQDVRFDDIAHALANIPRFAGQTKRFYSVAQHSLLVREIASYDDGLYALLHDATEAYLGDVPSPIKHSDAFAGYREAEKRLHAAIMRHFGLAQEIPRSVKYADKLALELEAIWHMSPLIDGWNITIDKGVLHDWREWKTAMSSEEAEERFHATFEYMWREFLACQPEYDSLEV